MIVIIRADASTAQKECLFNFLQDRGAKVRESQTGGTTILNLDDCSGIPDPKLLQCFAAVESVAALPDPFKHSGRKNHPEDTAVTIDGAKIGNKGFCVIAGPCTIENEEQILSVARSVKAAGADLLRGGAFKPRTSPYDFQGLQEEGLQMLLRAKAETGLPVVSEITDIRHLPLFRDVDLIQVGARNCQNYELLRELGHSRKPILLKRGASCTLRELLLSAEYILSGGNENVILCERGIRTFEGAVRNTLDLSAVPMLHELSHLPVIVDPSHGTGLSRLVSPMAAAAVACGADGLIVEVHNDPKCARCDGVQALEPAEFRRMMTRIQKIRRAVND